MKRKSSLSITWLLALTMSLLNPSHSSAALDENELRIGQKFEIVGPLYAHGVCDDLRSRELSIISLVPLRLRGSEILSQELVPIGSILTVVDKAPNRVFAFLYPDRYVVHVNTIAAPAGIPVVIDLSRGIEGKLTLLNPTIFKPLF